MTQQMEQPQAFPFRPLDAVQADIVYKLCGGEEPKLWKAREFMRVSGQEAIPDPLYREYLKVLGYGVMDAMGFDIADPQVNTDFTRGVLLYAGTVSMVGFTKELPVSADVLRIVNDTDRQNTGIEARQEVGKLSSFVELFARYAGDFRWGRSYDGFEAALVGAGTAHILTKMSHVAGPTPVREVDPDDPDAKMRRILASMEAEFSDLDFAAIEQTVTGDKQTVVNVAIGELKKPLQPLPPLPYLGETDKRVSQQKGQLK